MSTNNLARRPVIAGTAKLSALRAHTVLIVEASSGGIVGGSLTGLIHQVRGMHDDWRPVMALYERKTIEPELNHEGVRVFHVSRWRMGKEHPLQRLDSYQQARRFAPVRSGLRFGRLAVRTIAEELPAAIRLARIIRAERADVVHLGNGLRANFDGVLACWMTRTPCLCHVKGFEKYGGRERWASRHVDAVLCMTDSVRQHCLRSGIRAPRVEVIYDALAPEHFRPTREREEMRVDLGLPPQTIAFGIVGGVQEWKGQAEVIEAFALARTRSTANIRLLVVGGPHRAGHEYLRHLQNRVNELGLRESVRFTGFRSDIPDVMNALDVIVHASIRPEPFGRVILEAMLLGKPVIASASGGVLEFVEEGRTGFLVPPSDVEKLAERMHTLGDDPSLGERVGAQARTVALERFSLGRHIDAVTALYDALLKEKHDA